MMQRKMAFVIFLITLLSFPFLGTNISMAQEKVRILMKNGNEVVVSSYYEEGSMLYYYKYGSYIGVQKSNIISVKPVHEDPTIEAVEPSPEFAKKEAEKRSALSACEKKKKMAEKNVRFYCGNLEGIRANTGKTPVTAGSIRNAYKTRQGCDYYKGLLEHYLKECP